MNKWFERKFAKYGNDMNEREGKGKKWVNEDFLFRFNYLKINMHSNPMIRSLCRNIDQLILTFVIFILRDGEMQ